MEAREPTSSKGLKKNDILEFFTLIHDVELKEGQSYAMISNAYYLYVISVLNSSKKKPDTLPLLKQLKELKEKALVKASNGLLDSIIRDIEENGAMIKKVLSKSKKKDTTSKFIDKLKKIKESKNHKKNSDHQEQAGQSHLELAVACFMNDGDRLATLNNLSEAIQKYTEAIRTLEMLNKLNGNQRKTSYVKLNSHSELGVEALNKLLFKLASTYQVFALQMWEIGGDTTSNLDIVLNNLECAMYTLDKISKKSEHQNLLSIQLHNDMVNALIQRGDGYLKETQYDLAIRDYQQALVFTEKNPDLIALTRHINLSLARAYARFAFSDGHTSSQTPSEPKFATNAFSKFKGGKYKGRNSKEFDSHQSQKKPR